MNRDDIIRMARDAGLYVGTNLSGVTLVGLRPCLGGSYEDDGLLVHLDLDDIERFAALVAAAEREACARVCEAEARMWDSLEVTGRGKDADMAEASRTCAAAIRARSEG